MTSVAIFRAAHLLGYIDVLRMIGAPVERDLRRSRLPGWVEEMPDEYISLPLAMDFLWRCGRDLHPMELGVLGSSRLSQSVWRQSLVHRIRDAPTGFARLIEVLRAIHAEDNVLRLGLRREGRETRVIIGPGAPDVHPLFCLLEWHEVHGILMAVGRPSGAAWSPREITFTSRCELPQSLLDGWPYTRFLVGQSHTSVLIDNEVLARPTDHAADGATGEEKGATDPDDDAVSWTFASTLRALIRPYLGDGYPDIASVAEIAGMSTRTLQRRLQGKGWTYSDIIKEARFHLARELLSDESLRVIDIALMCGYDNPQHFSRAFRRLSGVAPKTYRQTASQKFAPTPSPAW